MLIPPANAASLEPLTSGATKPWSIASLPEKHPLLCPGKSLMQQVFRTPRSGLGVRQLCARILQPPVASRFHRNRNLLTTSGSHIRGAACRSADLNSCRILLQVVRAASCQCGLPTSCTRPAQAGGGACLARGLSPSEHPIPIPAPASAKTFAFCSLSESIGTSTHGKMGILAYGSHPA